MANRYLDYEITVDPNGSGESVQTIEQALAYIAAFRVNAQHTTAALQKQHDWTIRLVGGIFERDTQIDLRNLVGITLCGAGKEATTLRATKALLDTQFLSLSDANVTAFVHMGATDHVRLENMFIDARFYDDGTFTSSKQAAVYCPQAVKATFVNVRAEGIRYGIWEDEGTVAGANYTVDMFNTSCRAIAAVGVGTAIWHIFSCDLIGTMESGKTLMPGSDYTGGLVAVAANASGNYNTTLWGCHVHGESDAGLTYSSGSIGGVAIATAGNNGKIFIVGTTVHCKLLTDPPSVSGGNGCIRISGSSPRLVLIGCDLLLESGTGFGATTGSVIAHFAFGATVTATIDMVGCNLLDTAGSSTGKQKRGWAATATGASVASVTINARGNNFANVGPSILASVGASFMTGGPTIRGTATLAAGTAVVRLLPAGTNKGGAAATSFTNANTAVTGSGTTFLSDFKPGDYIKAASHADSAWTQISTITNDTSMTLVTGGYRGATLATTQAQVAVPDPTTQPSVHYGVVITAGVTGETFSVTGKHESGFTITSSNGASTAVVDWILLR